MVVYWNSNEEHHDLMRFKHDLTCFEWDIIAGMSWKHLWEYGGKIWHFATQNRNSANRYDDLMNNIMD